MIRKTALLIGFTILSIFNPVHADPSKEILYLMNEPVSMLDWTLFEIEQRFSDLCIPEDSYNCSMNAMYSFSTNEIVIYRNIYIRQEDNIETLKQSCKDAIDWIKLFQTKTTYREDISHHFWQSQDSPNIDDISQQLYESTRIYLHIHIRDENTIRPVMTCSARLSDDTVFFSDRQNNSDLEDQPNKQSTTGKWDVAEDILNGNIKQERKNEVNYIIPWCSSNSGRKEVLLRDNTLCDCVTDTHAVEFDFAENWTEAVGQALHFARMTAKKPGIVLILRSKDDKKYMDRLNQEIEQYNLPIEVWSIQEY
ncbi:hypothetical protein [Desulfatibacillum aliphaticivorans]|uniref:hypothetical protein n=1 Tax=Desulfatibacillum aliphaticivorans TaxID=218208 RepID=UPI0003F56459|nr:hypothetical protein [Desulfatibacillum aliphaticivorans]